MKYLARATVESLQLSAEEQTKAYVERELYARIPSVKPANSIFLSHSHKDREIVLKVKKFLETQNASIYIDWLDETMPEKTSGETATRIKGKIDSSRRFAAIITENSISSKWVPWELGYADKAKVLRRLLWVNEGSV